MRKDPTKFRKRFAAYKEGKMPYKAGRIISDENNISDQQYINIMEKVAADNYKQWGFENEDLALLYALNDNTYNYRGYYNKYPNGQGNAIDHWTDEFKTVWHPTFSNESIYSGKKSQYNPKGLKGGHWEYGLFGEKFIPAKWQRKPKYEDGKTPMLDRLEFDDGTKYLQWEKEFLDKYWSSEELKRLGLDPKKEAIRSMLHGNTAFNAGTLQGVVIKPPKDSKKVLSEAKEMLPIDKMRHNWYNNIDQIRDGFYPANNIDPYEYIRRMYNIYEASDKPRVSTTRVPEYTILHNPFDISGKEREMYDPILNTMYLNPDRPSFIDEMSHAFQFNTDVPGDNDLLPGDWEIDGKSGYERPGHAEYTAHKIIQPTLRHYLENQDTDFPIDDIIKVVTDIHDNPKDWGYPTREEVMNGKRSGRIARGPRRGQLKNRYEDGKEPDDGFLQTLKNLVTRRSPVDYALWKADRLGAPSHVTNAMRDFSNRIVNFPIIAADAAKKYVTGEKQSIIDAYKEADVNPSLFARALLVHPYKNDQDNYSEEELSAIQDLVNRTGKGPGIITYKGYRSKNKGRYAGDISYENFNSPHKVIEWSLGQTGRMSPKGKDPVMFDDFAYDVKDTKGVYLKKIINGEINPAIALRSLFGIIGSKGYSNGSNSATSIRTEIPLKYLQSK